MAIGTCIKKVLKTKTQQFPLKKRLERVVFSVQAVLLYNDGAGPLDYEPKSSFVNNHADINKVAVNMTIN